LLSRRSVLFTAVAAGTALVAPAYATETNAFDPASFDAAQKAGKPAVGVILLVPRFQERLALAGAPLATWSDRHFRASQKGGLSGQISVGLLLGAVWSPCVGPTLGAASILAAQGRDLGEVAATMLAFGLGAALPLAALGLLSREALLRWRTHLISGGSHARMLFAIVLVAIGVMVLAGLDKRIETLAVNESPQWLTDLTTRF
jgi:cytochrome c-type biogenesis protein